MWRGKCFWRDIVDKMALDRTGAKGLSMTFSKVLQTMAVCVGLFSVGGANAAQVTCGDSTLGVRVALVDPGLVSGYCYAQLGNLKNQDIAGLGLSLIEKDVYATGDTSNGVLRSSGSTNSGNWSFDASIWNSWNQVFLGFHFGNGPDSTLANPDSFIVELAKPDSAGTWALAGTNAKLTGLSNVYLLGKGTGGGGGQTEIPEPASIALVGLGLLGASFARRRRA